MDNAEEIKKIAINLNEILEESPSVFYYIEGYIDCFLQKKRNNKQSISETKEQQLKPTGT